MSREVPSGWTRTSIDAVASNVSDKWEPSEGAQAYVGLEHIDQGSGNLLARGDTSQLQSIKTHFRPGDTLFGKLRPNLRKTALVDFTGVASTDILVIRPSRKLISEFLFYRLSSEELFDHAIRSSAGTKMPRTSWKEIGEFEFPLPPLREQQQIAEILSSVDEAIAATRAVIEQTRKVKQAVLERLLTKGIGHTRFKQTEIGEIPEAWEVAKFGEVFKLTSGKLKSVKSLATEKGKASPYPAYGGNGIAGFSSDYLVDGELVVIGRVGEYCGSAYRSSGKAWITDNALYTKEFLAEVDPDFVAYAFTRVPLKNIRGGGGQPLVSQTAIYAQILALPSLAEQKAIVEILKSFDSAESDLQRLRLVEIKSALMSDLLTGRKRVTDSLPMAAE